MQKLSHTHPIIYEKTEVNSMTFFSILLLRLVHSESLINYFFSKVSKLEGKMSL